MENIEIEIQVRIQKSETLKKFFEEAKSDEDTSRSNER